MEVALSVIEIASFGLEVSNAIYQYASSVRKADERIRLLGTHVKYTAVVMEELGRVFQQDETSQIVSASAIGTAKGMVQECDTLFQSIERVLTDGKKHQWKWPFRQPDVDLHMANLDRLKTTLNLLMSVMTCGQAVAAQGNKDTVAKLRQDVERLVFEKQYAAMKYEELKNQLDSVQGQPPPYVEQNPFINTHASTGSATGTATAPRPHASRVTSDRLETCSQSIKMLLGEVERMRDVLSSESRDSVNHDEFSNFQSRWNEVKRRVEQALQPPAARQTSESRPEARSYIMTEEFSTPDTRQVASPESEELSVPPISIRMSSRSEFALLESATSPTPDMSQSEERNEQAPQLYSASDTVPTEQGPGITVDSCEPSSRILIEPAGSRSWEEPPEQVEDGSDDVVNELLSRWTNVSTIGVPAA